MAIFSKTGKSIQTDICLHPGEVLKDELEEREIKQKDFAADIGIPVTQLNEIINGKRIVSSELAIILEAALGVSASFWTNLQSNFDLGKARTNEKVVTRKESVQLWSYIKQYINVNYLRKVNELGDNIDSNIEKVKLIFNINNWNEIESLTEKTGIQYFKQSQLLNINQENLTTWINYAKYCAQFEKVNKFNPEDIYSLLDILKNFFLKEDILNNTKNTLTSYGIKFLIKDKLEGVNVDGVTFWSIDNPVIVLTLRHKRIDNFVFTLFHELAHIHLHLKENKDIVIIDNIEENESSEKQNVEDEANEFASNNLIDNSLWKDFIRKTHRFDDETIISFSQSVGVPSAIVRGRLCKEKLVSYSKKTNISYKLV